MEDKDFEQLVARVEQNKSDSTASQYVSKILKFRDWIQEQGKELRKPTPSTLRTGLQNLMNFTPIPLAWAKLLPPSSLPLRN